MFNNEAPQAVNSHIHQVNASQQVAPKVLGDVIFCSGVTVIVSTALEPEVFAKEIAVSKMVTIHCGAKRLVAVVSSVELTSPSWDDNAINAAHLQLELIGEVYENAQNTQSYFDNGLSVFPTLGAKCYPITQNDLVTIFNKSVGKSPVSLGNLVHNPAIPAAIDLEKTLSRHFAILGTTGVGKSSATSIIVNKILQRRAKTRVVMFDPHNEYASSFKGKVKILDISTICVPYWMLNFDELIQVIFSNQEGFDFEIDLLRSLIPEAKMSFSAGAATRIGRRSIVADGLDGAAGYSKTITADTPLPYRINDVIKYIDDKMGKLESRNDLQLYRRLMDKLKSVTTDPRYELFFNMRLVSDNMEEVLEDIYRIGEDTDQPIAIFQLAGVAPEVVNSLVSIVSRLAFEICQMSGGGREILILCEEAHRYMPKDRHKGAVSTQRALAQIAKEGRKYGCYLGCITQRPGELDPTILSQCSTIFALRLANDYDQEIIKSAISASSTSKVSMLSALAQREAIVFGEGVPIPMHMKFEEVAVNMLPTAHGVSHQGNGDNNEPYIRRAMNRLRGISNPGEINIAMEQQMMTGRQQNVAVVDYLNEAETFFNNTDFAKRRV